MKRKSIITMWMRKSSVLATVALAMSSSCIAQTNYISIIGNHGCTTTDYDHRVSCIATPSSSTLTAISLLSDPIHSTPFGYSPTTDQLLYSSVYDNTGNVLLSVNADGVYGNSGDQLYRFRPSSYSFYTPPGCTGSSAGNYVL